MTGAAAVVDDGTGRGVMSGGRREQRDAVVPAGELVGGVDGGVAAAAERGLVGTAQHRRLRALARVAPDLHARARDAHPRAHTGGEGRMKLLLEKQMRVLLDLFSVGFNLLGRNKSPRLLLQNKISRRVPGTLWCSGSPLFPCPCGVVSARVHVCPLSPFRVHHGSSLKPLVLLSI